MKDRAQKLKEKSVDYCQQIENDPFKLDIELEYLIEKLTIDEMHQLSDSIQEVNGQNPQALEMIISLADETKWSHNKEKRRNIYQYEESTKD